MFTRQHYKAIARLIRERLTHTRDPEVLTALANDFIRYFRTDNPAFDALKFIAAIEGE